MRILVFGDSITQGFFDEERGGWCSRLINLVMKREYEAEYEYNKSVVNLGVSGDTTEDLLKRVKTETEARLLKYPTSDYDVAILAAGINDSQFDMETKENKIPVEVTVKNLREICAFLGGHVEKIVIVGITSVFDERIQPMAWKTTHGYSNEDIGKYNSAIKKFAIDNSLVYIDVEDIYDDPDACLPDGLHPNAHGHNLIYERVKKTLEAEGIL